MCVHDAQVMGWTAAAILLGSILYPLLQHAREQQWCTFLGTSPHDFSDALRGKFVAYSAAPSRANSGDVNSFGPETGLVNGNPEAGLPDRLATGPER